MKIHPHQLFLLLITVALLTVGACNSEGSAPASRQPENESASAGASHVDTAGPIESPATSPAPAVDTAMPPRTDVDTAPIPQPRYAELGYNFKPRMARNTMQTITAFVKVRTDSAGNQIRQIIERRLTRENNGIERKDDTTFVYPDEISVYKHLTVKLKGPPDQCSIDAEDNERQEINLKKGNIWHWNLTAKTSMSEINLRLVVHGEEEDGTESDFPAVTLPIKIILSQKESARSIGAYLTDNPAVTWSAILGLAAFAGWLIKWLLGRKKPEEEKSKGKEA